MFKRKKKKTGCETPEYRCPTMPPVRPPKPPTSGSNAVKPSELLNMLKASPVTILPNDISTVTIMCQYETPCGWCCKWDKKCDKKIGCDDDKPKRGLRAKAGLYDEAMSRSDAQEVIETIKSGKLPPLNKNNTYGLETRG